MAEGRLIVAPLDDHLYSATAWVADVQRKMRAIVPDHGNHHGFQNRGTADFRVALTVYGKDSSSYYLKLFPEWENIQIDSQYGTFSSTDVRRRYFQRILEIADTILSLGVADFLRSFVMSEICRSLLEEAEYLDVYPKQWGVGPLTTADALVVQSGHILLVERGQAPGKGLLALPGGFVNPAERIRDAAFGNCARKPQSATAYAHRGSREASGRCKSPDIGRSNCALR